MSMRFHVIEKKLKIKFFKEVRKFLIAKLFIIMKK